MKKKSYLFILLDVIVLALLAVAVALYFIEVRDKGPEFFEPLGTFTREPTVENLENNIVKISWSLPQQYENNQVLFQGEKQLSVMRTATKKSITGSVGARMHFDEETKMYVYEGLFEVGSCTNQQRLLCNFDEDMYIFQTISLTGDTGVVSQLQAMELSQ